MTLGQRLRDLRAQKGMTQQELSDSIKIPRSTIGMYEADHRKPRFDELDALADYFDTSLDYLLCKTDINAGYPGHEHNRFMMDPDAVRRLSAYGVALVKAYNAASEDTQAAVNAILHIDQTFSTLERETREKKARRG